MDTLNQNPGSSSPSQKCSPIACARCHKRKKRCDRLLPTCSACSASRAECVYNVESSEKVKQRHLATLSAENESLRSRIATLERQNGLLAPFDSTAVDRLMRSVPRSYERDLTYTYDSSSWPRPQNISTPQQPSPSQSASCAEVIVTNTISSHWNDFRPYAGFGAKIAEYLGTSQSPKDDMTHGRMIPPAATPSPWPPLQLAEALIQAYFKDIHIAYPMLDQEVIMSELYAIYKDNNRGPVVPDAHIPSVQVYRFLILFAIGCNLLEQHTKMQRTTMARLRRSAFEHLPAALRADDLTCLSSLLLLAIYSYVDYADSDPYQLLRMLGQLALSRGFHQPQLHLPLAEQNARRRLFWSIYSLDRCVAFTLSKPVNIPKEVIRVDMPTSVGTVSENCSVDLFRAHVSLRTMQEQILQHVYLHPNHDNRENCLSRIRNDIDDWYSHLPRSNGRDDSLQPWFVLGFHYLIVSLYRPSPLCAKTSPLKMPLLRRAAWNALDYCGVVVRELFLVNHITIVQIVAICSTLVYTISELEGDSDNIHISSWRRDALTQIARAESILADFCLSYPGADHFVSVFKQSTAKIKCKLGEKEGPTLPPPQNSSAPSVTGSSEDTLNAGPPSLEVAFQNGSLGKDAMLTSGHGFALDAPLYDTGLAIDLDMFSSWDAVNHSSDIEEDFTQPLNIQEAGNMDDLLASLGIEL